MKAKVKYSNGLMLEISKENNSMMLFLEHVSTFNAGCNYVHHVKNLYTKFQIRLNTTKIGYQQCRDYINANL